MSLLKDPCGQIVHEEMQLQNAPMMSLSQVKAFGQEEAEFILVDLHSTSYQHE